MIDAKILKTILAYVPPVTWGTEHEWCMTTGDDILGAYITACSPERVTRILDQLDECQETLQKVLFAVQFLSGYVDPEMHGQKVADQAEELIVKTLEKMK